jgi:hypothetical protein
VAQRPTEGLAWSAEQALDGRSRVHIAQPDAPDVEPGEQASDEHWRNQGHPAGRSDYGTRDGKGNESKLWSSQKLSIAFA